MNILIRITIITIATLLTCHADMLSALQKKRNIKLHEIDTIYLLELNKLKTIYMRSGKLDEANKVAVIIESVTEELEKLKDTDKTEEINKLSKLKVSSKTVIAIHALKAGMNRLSGYNSIFSTIDDNFKDANFVRVPWQSKPKMTVTFEEDGYFYLGAGGEITIEGKDIKKMKVKSVVNGPWLDLMKFYKVTGEKGAVVTCAGDECFLIAQDISITPE